MWCPAEDCKSSNVRNVYTFGPDHPRMNADLRGLNITRRMKVCLDCDTKFSTIEVLEKDFDALKKPPGRLETNRESLRAGGKR